MSSKIYFQNAVDGTPSYTAEDFSSIFGAYLTNGIVCGQEGAGFACTFSPTSTKEAVSVIVQPGAVCTDGKLCVFDEAETVSIGAVGGETLIRWISVVYNLTTKSVALETQTSEPTATASIFPLAKITVYPKSQSAKIDTIEDLRQTTGYVSGILSTAKTYGSILSTAYGNITTLTDAYEDLASQVAETGTVITVGMTAQTLTAEDFPSGTATITVPEGGSILGYELYLNGRAYTGPSITVSTADGKVSCQKMTGQNNIIIVIFYGTAGGQVLTV